MSPIWKQQKKVLSLPLISGIMKNVMATDELLRKYYENIMAFFSTLGALVVITV